LACRRRGRIPRRFLKGRIIEGKPALRPMPHVDDARREPQLVLLDLHLVARRRDERVVVPDALILHPCMDLVTVVGPDRRRDRFQFELGFDYRAYPLGVGIALLPADYLKDGPEHGPDDQRYKDYREDELSHS
jgi:hypothetical protein